jgi:signal transduction histidine kinase
MVTTALISALYLVQLNIRRSLELTNKNLEKIVEQRTEELTKTNLELHSLNENLEQLVQERTDKIKTQLNQILKYAHMNSHEVRAPLARLLGLIDLLKKEKDDAQREGLLARINTSSIELDEIVKKMNRLLEEEVPTINGT